MKIKVDSAAPDWAQRAARSAESAIEGQIWPFISRQRYTVSQLTAAFAAANPWRMAIVKDGAANKFVAISNGTAFYYLEGSAV